jgi:hypothetical protein
MSQGVQIAFEPLKTLAFGSVAAGYTAIGTAFANPVRNITLTNLTDTTVIFSYDGGVTDHDVLPAGSGKVYDFAANKSNSGGMSAFQKGGRVYVKRGGGAPLVGAVYVSAFYCLGD